MTGYTYDSIDGSSDFLEMKAMSRVVALLIVVACSDVKIRLILDDHSSHTSRETNAYLRTVPNRFEFVFTPVHGSWLNLVEPLFSKMARSVLRHIRVSGKDELRSRIDDYFQDLNAAPQVLRWKHGIEDLTVV